MLGTASPASRLPSARPDRSALRRSRHRPLPHRLLGREDVAGLGEVRDPGRDVHGLAVHVSVLEDHGSGLDADVRGRQPGGRSALAHLQRRTAAVPSGNRNGTEEGLRRRWLAGRTAGFIWDYEGWDSLTTRQIRAAREAPARSRSSHWRLAPVSAYPCSREMPVHTEGLELVAGVQVTYGLISR